MAILCKIRLQSHLLDCGGAWAEYAENSLSSAGPVILLGLAAATALSGRVALLSLGEEAARGWDFPWNGSRTVCLFVVLLLAGGSVALAGPVAFVGLMVPHVVRYLQVRITGL